MGGDGLIIFAKPPVEGTVKTRLHERLSPAEATELYTAFLDDSLEQYSNLGVELRLYFSEALHGDVYPVKSEVEVFRQRGAGLGERMAHAFVETFAAGFERIVIIGTDHPSLPPSFLRQAFLALQETRSVVIGPSEDGGYYLLGMNEFLPGLFEDMSYSHPGVFDDTTERIRTSGAGLTVLPIWYDVDTPDMLGRLLEDLLAGTAEAPRTMRLLDQLSGRHAWIGRSHGAQ